MAVSGAGGVGDDRILYYYYSHPAMTILSRPSNHGSFYECNSSFTVCNFSIAQAVDDLCLVDCTTMSR